MDIKTKRGFLFVITVFLILTYILLSISVWVKAVEASERTYSELYKESTVELVIEQLTPAKVSNISNIVMTRGVFVLNKHAVDSPLNAGPEDDEYYYIEKAMLEYLEGGSPGEENFNNTRAPESEYNASLGGWVGNLNASLLAIGVYIDEFEIYDDSFTFEQTGIDTLSYSFDMKISLRDTTGTTSLSRTYEVDGTVNITGFVDPAITRETKAINEPVYRQFFFMTGLYPDVESLNAGKEYSIDAGQGWFYGPLVGVSGAASMPDEHKHRYIVYGDYSAIRGLGDEEMNKFGGFILTNRPGDGGMCTYMGSDYTGEIETFNAISYTGIDCDPEIEDIDTMTNKPYVVVPAFDYEDMPDCPDLVRDINRKCVLFIANADWDDLISDPEAKLETEHTGVFNIEALRDYTMCGYYVPNPDSPSYLQRLLPGSYSRNHSLFGIETFLIGEYMEPADYEQYDRLDREMFNGTMMDYFIRGMPGCKHQGMCSNTETVTGRFGLSTGTIEEYDIENIDCNGGAGCSG